VNTLHKVGVTTMQHPHCAPSRLGGDSLAVEPAAETRAHVKAAAVAARRWSSDNSLIRRSPPTVLAAAAGDQSDWDTLVERHAQQVWAVARSVGLDASIAATIVVLTFRRLADHLDELRTDAEVSSWLSATAESEACKVCYDAWLSGEPARRSEAL